MSRPSTRTEEIEERILAGLIDGMSMVQICEQEGMPNRRTVMRWMEADEGFASRCARAREMQADFMDDKIIELIETVTPENATAARVKLAALQWRASKLAPKKYGDKIEQHITGSMELTTKEQRDAAVAAAIQADR